MSWGMTPRSTDAGSMGELRSRVRVSIASLEPEPCDRPHNGTRHFPRRVAAGAAPFWGSGRGGVQDPPFGSLKSARTTLEPARFAGRVAPDRSHFGLGRTADQGARRCPCSGILALSAFSRCNSPQYSYTRKEGWTLMIRPTPLTNSTPRPDQFVPQIEAGTSLAMTKPGNDAGTQSTARRGYTTAPAALDLRNGRTRLPNKER